MAGGQSFHYEMTFEPKTIYKTYEDGSIDKSPRFIIFIESYRLFLVGKIILHTEKRRFFFKCLI